MMPSDYRPNDPLATEKDFNGDPATIDDRVDRTPAQRRTPVATMVMAVLLVAAIIALIVWLV
ncbi:MAG TPA: hypothetical protein VLB85_12705 [Acidimicrobiia bacterium]|nr:hypothetical protein [Acidimicrobiia bacterium]HSJ35904.1 hypothetical protein [Acidimicrobiia bacterium]